MLISDLNWSEWRTILERSGHEEAAVYMVRIVDAEGHVRPIARFMATDTEGVVYIGKAENMERRRRRFITGMLKCKGHSGGKFLNLLIRYTPFGPILTSAQYEYRFARVADDAEATRAEAACILGYCMRFAEPPPLNSAVPGRYTGWKTEG